MLLSCILSLPLSLKAMKKMSLGEDKNIYIKNNNDNNLAWIMIVFIPMQS